MTVATEIVTPIRVEVEDLGETRWDDDTEILPLIQKATRRCNNLIAIHRLPFAKTVQAYTVNSSAYQNLSLPTDHLCNAGDDAMWRTDTAQPVKLKTEQDWQAQLSGSGDKLESWRLDLKNKQFDFREAPGSDDDDVTCNLIYFYKSDADNLATTDDAPWNGALNDLIIEYASLRLKNIDEMDWSMDMNLLADFENKVLQRYQQNQVKKFAGRGWNHGGSGRGWNRGARI